MQASQKDKKPTKADDERRRKLLQPVTEKELQTFERSLEYVTVKGSPGKKARRFVVEGTALDTERFGVILRDVSRALALLEVDAGVRFMQGNSRFSPEARSWAADAFGAMRACELGRYTDVLPGLDPEILLDRTLDLVSSRQNRLLSLELGILTARDVIPQIEDRIPDGVP